MKDDGGMYIVTNREVFEGRSGFDQFGESPSPKGPLELRIAKVLKRGREWQIDIQPDKVVSQVAAKMIFDRLKASPRSGPKRKDLLFFVHGFNNDVKAVIERAWALQTTYNLEVFTFTWPANGGGIKGVASYKSDKRDAIASVGALDRVLEKIRDYVTAFREKRLKELRALAESRSKNSREAESELFARLNQKDCPFRVSLMIHSMGNYLFKNLLRSSSYHGDELIFDNVILAAADTNNKGHRDWMDRIEARNRVYVTINEDDSALRVARMKGGDKQFARLGHYPYNLDSRQTVYVDFSEARSVGSSHAYFEGKPIQNTKVKQFFRRAFHGEVAEKVLPYDAARNLYKLK